jgi:hypothetical protein
MRNPAVVAQKKAAVLEQIGERGERQILRQRNPTEWKRLLQPSGAIFIRFPDNQEQPAVVVLLEQCLR